MKTLRVVWVDGGWRSGASDMYFSSYKDGITKFKNKRIVKVTLLLLSAARDPVDSNQ